MTETRGTTATPDRARPGRGGGGPIAKLGLLIRQVIAELRKVTWPTRQQLLTYWAVVLVFVVVMIAIVSVMDLAFGQAVFWLLG